MPPVPAKRYDLFISLFEKKVTEAQKEIAKMDSLMRPYEIIRTALEKADLPNEVKLDMKPQGIEATILLLDNDRRGRFDGIIKEVSAELLRYGLHPTGAPATGPLYCGFYFMWRLRGFDKTHQYPPSLALHINVPQEGTKWAKVRKEVKFQTYSDTSFHIIWLDAVEPAPALPPPVDEIPF